MNKFGFITFVLMIILYFFPLIPIGIYFGSSQNPWIGFNSYVQLYINIYSFESAEVYIWGIYSSSRLELWSQVHLISFFFLMVLLWIGIILIMIGTFKESEKGKKYVNYASIIFIICFLYVFIGIPVYSNEILGTLINGIEIFSHLNFGFYILLFCTILSIVARITHPIKD